MKGMKNIWQVIGMGLLALVGQLGAQGEERLELSAAASVQAYEPGHAFYIALRGKVAPTWHAYYRNPGSVGQAMQVRLESPRGFTVQGPYWQMPQRIDSAGIVSYGYEEPCVVWKVEAGEDAPAESEWKFSAEAQLCSAMGCLPQQEARAQLILRRGEAAPNPDWRDEERGAEVLGDTPLQDVAAEQDGAAYTLSFRKSGEAEGAVFIPDEGNVLPSGTQTLTRSGEAYVMRLPANDGKDMLYPAAQPDNGRLVGQLIFADGSHARVDVPLGQARGEKLLTDGFWGIVGALLVGGLLLNLMPCVFPVLGLKVMGFVELSGGSRGKVAVHALSFTAGVLFSFWALGLVLIALSRWEDLLAVEWSQWPTMLFSDAGGEGRTWAVWMQNEWVVYVLTLLLTVLGLWMYGVFELGARATGVGAQLQSKRGALGSFFQGLLVTVVATPCSAPFIGAALPAALSLPALPMLAALSAMALGLALPYVLLALFPSLVGFLPRPGEWMVSLRQALSFFLFAAAAWLIGVYLTLAPSAVSILPGLVSVAAGCWVYGRWCVLWRSWRSKLLGGLVALLLVLGGVWFSYPTASPSDDTLSDDAPSGQSPWQPWSPQLQQEALDEDRPVYVDFTAKWCLTCQANKATAYTPAVYALFAEHDVLLLRADNTRPNPDIDAALRSLHRSTVPTNVLYLPDDPATPIITRELLTPSYLLEFLNKHLNKP